MVLHNRGTRIRNRFSDLFPLRQKKRQFLFGNGATTRYYPVEKNGLLRLIFKMVISSKYVRTSGTLQAHVLQNEFLSEISPKPKFSVLACAWCVQIMCLMSAHHFSPYGVTIRTFAVPTVCSDLKSDKNSQFW